ncbi:NADH dehydrogenase [Roseivirga sp. 4D4]|uniref:NAD(P)/FAD-dependent oxidoreductase n=1 Tax=Roseivirga sp. 4D4 TaxID=1889784 RepID=UPI0008530459|nr:NAD(P)/FAD-dependent oxidoreductase [Roseivirga sp. 4D4]OEK03049.1 NADH dehydrogenase [Roseivirga sp. 4D4]
MDDHCAIDEQVCLPDNELPRVVVIGGGFAGLALVKSLKALEVQVVLIDRNNFHQFQPLLYQVATSSLEPDSIVFPFRKQLIDYKNVIFRYAEVLEIQASKSRVITNKGIIDYDYLVIATGTRTNFYGLGEIEAYGLGMKSIQDSLNIRHMMIQNLEQAAITCDDMERDTLTNFVIVGGGPAGVEMAGALAEFKKYILPKDYPEYNADIMDIYLLEAADKLLGAMSEKASSESFRYLTRMGVKVLFNEAVEHYDGSIVSTSAGTELRARNLIWTAGVEGALPRGIRKDSFVHGNRLRVNETLNVHGYANVFAIGDIASMATEDSPRGHPQVAQVALQQGKYLGKVMKHVISGRNYQKPFRYKDKGSLATIGKRRAVADLGKFRFAGYLAWILWSVVHLFSISGFRNKLMVGLNWAWNYMTFDKGNRLIISHFEHKAVKAEVIKEKMADE